MPARLLIVCVVAASLATAILEAAATGGADATFPGTNGRIAFIEGRGNVYQDDVFTMNPDGSARVRLTKSRADERFPAFSPDGSKVAFSRAVGKPGDTNSEFIAVMNADGSAVRRLTHDRGYDINPSFSPDGTQVVYSHYKKHDYANLWVVNTDGSHPHQMTHLRGNELGATYSPDGRTIAFEHASGNIDVDVMNADGSGIRALTTHEGDDFAAWPDFAPDGQSIVYAREMPNFDFEIWTMRPDGSGQSALTHGHEDDGPVFSPDGTLIAFDREVPGIGPNRRSGIEIVSADSGRTHQIRGTTSRDSQPSWAPAPMSPSTASGGTARTGEDG